MARLRKLALGLVVSAALLAGAEGLLRALIPVDRLLFSWEKPRGALYATTSGHTIMNPGVTTVRQDGPHRWTMTINGQGFREDAETPIEAPPGQTRWLALGDSWMLGFNADQGKSVPDLVEARLRAAGEDIEVINNGQFGSSGFDMLVAWRAAQTLRPDALLIGWPHNGSRQRDLREARKRWYANTRAAPASDARLYLLARHALFRFTRPANPQLSDAEAVEALGDLAVLAGEARRAGVPVRMILWPTRYGGRVDAGEAEQIARTLRPLGVSFAGHSLPQRSCWGHEDLFHPSEAGYAAIAERVISLVQEGESAVLQPANPSCNEMPGDAPGR